MEMSHLHARQSTKDVLIGPIYLLVLNKTEIYNKQNLNKILNNKNEVVGELL